MLQIFKKFRPNVFEKFVKKVKPKFIIHAAAISRPMDLHEKKITNVVHLKSDKQDIDEFELKKILAVDSNFNIKDFHSTVLDHGNPPLFIVEELVDKMIEEALN